MKKWLIYLSEEIHTDWREQIIDGAKALNLPVEFTSPVVIHEASDAVSDMLGAQDKPYWRDHQSSKVNAIRTKKMIENGDVAEVRFGDKYKLWNTAFDAGFCTAVLLFNLRKF